MSLWQLEIGLDAQQSGPYDLENLTFGYKKKYQASIITLSSVV